MAKKTTKKTTTETKEPKFYLHELREHSRTLFKVKPEVFDGVFLNYKKKQITKDEAQKKIDAFLERKVQKKKKEVK
jgi:hypothetical protein